ncbi:hypothetical protein INT43_001441 [Umbelopsis isabellina]|uniref:F-box domain-containing protein n=1 Tax=Mortierella isabellina TaxID=91625 RepID=A0A8H7U7R1_MORIS|nr:hypothetical protein INT43_001441 [Umbelopsis isabellina]
MTIANERHPLFTLPTELLVHITCHLSLPTYIAAAMTSTCFHSRLMSREIIVYLRARFNLNPHSGNMIVFAYHTGLITRAPTVCEIIFKEFFVCSPTAGREQSVRAWAVLYALHRATRVYYEPLLSEDDAGGQKGLSIEMRSKLCPLHQCGDRRAQNLAFIQRYVHYMLQLEEKPANATFSYIHTLKTYHTIFLQVLKEGDLNVLTFYLQTYGPPFQQFRLRGDEYDDINIGASSIGTPLWLPPREEQQQQQHQTDVAINFAAPSNSVLPKSASNLDHIDRRNFCRCHLNQVSSGQAMRLQVKKTLEQYGVHVIDGCS